MKIKDMVGMIFGELVVERLRERRNSRSQAVWVCRCTCGNLHEVLGSSLRGGCTKSCGCARGRLVSKATKGISRPNASGINSPRWRGGRSIDKDGYVQLTLPSDHPRRAYSHKGAVKEHILVMEKQLGRFLVKGETVHHKNGVRSDNRSENLELWVRAQPTGIRIEDSVEHAVSILQLHAPHLLQFPQVA